VQTVLRLVTGQRQRGRSSSPGREKELYFLHTVQTSSEVHPASYLICTEGSFVGSKAAGEADHSLPSSAEVKKTWIYTSTWRSA
jgi:hypothetical protein